MLINVSSGDGGGDGVGSYCSDDGDGRDRLRWLCDGDAATAADSSQ